MSCEMSFVKCLICKKQLACGNNSVQLVLNCIWRGYSLFWLDGVDQLAFYARRIAVVNEEHADRIITDVEKSIPI